jgi:hypothetical protein
VNGAVYLDRDGDPRLARSLDDLRRASEAARFE